MVKKTIAIVLAGALIYSTIACYSTKIYNPKEFMVEEKQDIDFVVLKNGKSLNLENGYIEGDKIYGDVIRSIPLSSIVEAYGIRGNTISSKAIEYESQQRGFTQFLFNIAKAKLTNDEIVNFLEIQNYKDGIITVVIERGKMLFNRDEIAAVPVKQEEKKKIDTVVLKDGKRISLINGVITNNKVFGDVHRLIPLISIIEAYKKDGHVITAEALAYQSDKRNFLQYISNVRAVKLDTDEIANFAKVIDYDKGVITVLVEKQRELFSLNDIATAEVKVVNPFTTGLAIFGAITGLFLGIGLIDSLQRTHYSHGSCPFIYSFDNEQFVMDAEPFGGSICEPLARTDYCRIDYSKPVDNNYVFRIANTRDEIEYIDEFNLYVIDHSPKYTVIPDSGGRFHLIGKAIEPEQITVNGHPETVGYLIADDQKYWSSDLATKVNLNDSDLRDEIVMTFPKPKDADKCNLIVKGGNTAWSSDFLMGVIGLAGENKTQFTNPGILEQIKWISVEQREEIFHLKVQAWKDDNWSTVGIIPGGDISIVETRVIPLDLRGIEGDHLKIRINPPAGFWKFDWIAVDYNDDQIKDLKELQAVYAKGDDGKDISDSIKTRDRKYYVMPKTGDEAVVIFEAPPPGQDLMRSVFAKVSGYYSPNFSDNTQARMDIIDRIFSEPGFIVKYSLQEYQKWYKSMIAGK